MAEILTESDENVSVVLDEDGELIVTNHGETVRGIYLSEAELLNLAEAVTVALRAKLA